MLRKQQVPTFRPEIYTSISLNDLVTYSVYFLSHIGRDITAEDIVAACFLMFPARFSLRGYPEWPDATVVNKRWIDCRKKGLITGSTAHGFSLTPKGLQIGEKVQRILMQGKSGIVLHGAGKVRAETRTRAGRFVRELEKSAAYRAFLEKAEEAKISEFDFRSMLLCTMESSASTLKNNLEQFKQHVSLYERNDLVRFLDFCEKTFRRLLSGASVEDRQYRGGMLRQKVT